MLLSDRFVLPFEGPANAASVRAGGTRGFLHPRAMDSFVLRVAESDVGRLPELMDAAMGRHEAMHRALQAYRAAFLYELPLADQPAASGVVCAVITEVSRRFGPHLSAWRNKTLSVFSEGTQRS